MGLSKAKSPKPSEYDSNEEKLDPKFGLAYAKYIDSQHYTDGDFIAGQKGLVENESYRAGTQSNQRVKDYLLNGRDQSYGKFNFEPLNIIPKHLKVVKKALNLDLYIPKCKAIDNTSIEERKGERNKLVDAMINQEFARRQSQVLGMDFMPKGFIPTSDEDIDTYMETESTLPQEIAIEQALSAVREANNFNEIKNRLVDDVLTYGKCVVKDDYDPRIGVVNKRIYPVEYVQSYDGSEMNDNRDIFYAAHVESISLVDLHSRYGMDKNECLKWYVGYRGDRQFYGEKRENRKKWEDISSSMVRVMFFEFRTTFVDKYKKKMKNGGRSSVSKKPSDYSFTKSGEVETLERTREVWIEGAWIVDSEILLNYGVRTNMVIDSLKKVRSSYSSYDTNEMPLVRKMIPFADNMNLYVIKLNQMVSAARPKGVAINLSALLDVPQPDGDGTMSYLQLVNMFNESGNQLYRLDEFSAGQSIPITELENGLPADIGKYVDLYNHNLNQINIITGVNPQLAGMGAESRVSAESNQMANQASINSIEFVKDAVVSVEKRLSENTILRIQDIDKYDKPFKKYVQAIGMHNMEALNALDKLHPYTFSLYIEVLPNQDERQELREDLTIAMQTGQLTVVDKMEISQITNMKTAKSLLKRRIRENQEKEHARQLQLAQANQQAAMAKLQSEVQLEQARTQNTMQIDYQRYLYEKDIEAMKLGIKMEQEQANKIESAQKEESRMQHEKEKTVYQEREKYARQKDNQEFLASKEVGSGKSDMEKNMTKPGLKK